MENTPKSGGNMITKIIIAVVIALFIYALYWLLAGGGLSGSPAVEGGH